MYERALFAYAPLLYRLRACVSTPCAAARYFFQLARALALITVPSRAVGPALRMSTPCRGFVW